MRILFAILAILFGGLHAVAGVAQCRGGKAPATAPLMVLGGAMCACGGVFCLAGNALDWLMALCGGVIVCLCAIRNGMAQGKVHASHHAVRAVAMVAIAAALAFF